MSLLSSEQPRPLFLIQPRLDASEYRDRLIGAVVKYPYLPTEAYAPYQPKVLPKELVEKLDPKPVLIHNVSFFSSRIRDDEIRASFNGILDGFINRGTEKTHQSSAACARVWHMDYPSKKFQELLRDKAYTDELLALLKENPDRPLYFITSIVTLVDLTAIDEARKSSGIGAGVRIPVDPSTGLNVSAAAHAMSSAAAGASVTYDGEMIVLLGYREVTLEKARGVKAKLERAIGNIRKGFIIKDGNLKPVISETPAQGNTDAIMKVRREGADTDTDTRKSVEEMARAEATRQKEYEAVVKELGFDVVIWGARN